MHALALESLLDAPHLILGARPGVADGIEDVPDPGVPDVAPGMGVPGMAVPGWLVPGVVVPGVVVPGLDWPTLGRVVPDAPGVGEPGWVLIPGTGEGAGAGLVGPLPAPGVPVLGPGLVVCANAAPAAIRPTPAIARLESSFRCMVWLLLECDSITSAEEQRLCHGDCLPTTAMRATARGRM